MIVTVMKRSSLEETGSVGAGVAEIYLRQGGRSGGSRRYGACFSHTMRVCRECRRILRVLRVNLTLLGFGMCGELNLRLQMVLADTEVFMVVKRLAFLRKGDNCR